VSHCRSSRPARLRGISPARKPLPRPPCRATCRADGMEVVQRPSRWPLSCRCRYSAHRHGEDLPLRARFLLGCRIGGGRRWACRAGENTKYKGQTKAPTGRRPAKGLPRTLTLRWPDRCSRWQRRPTQRERLAGCRAMPATAKRRPNGNGIPISWRFGARGLARLPPALAAPFGLRKRGVAEDSQCCTTPCFLGKIA
jgi:hypothetical protein